MILDFFYRRKLLPGLAESLYRKLGQPSTLNKTDFIELLVADQAIRNSDIAQENVIREESRRRAAEVALLAVEAARAAANTSNSATGAPIIYRTNHPQRLNKQCSPSIVLFQVLAHCRNHRILPGYFSLVRT